MNNTNSDANFPLGSRENPIKCEDIDGERKYLSRLLGPNNEFLSYKRIGSTKGITTENILDAYKLNGIENNFECTVYIDMYHEKFVENKAALDLKIQPARVFNKNQKEEQNAAIKLLHELETKYNCTCPSGFMYIWAKANLLATVGPTLYSQNDFYSLPDINWDLKNIIKACRQISEEFRGFCKEHPIMIENEYRIEEVTNTFHHELVMSNAEDESDPTLFNVITFHMMDGTNLDWWFKIVSKNL
jgi:hypothetical protein